MLKLFPSHPEHPLADLRELQRAVTEIGSHTPDDALREATGWLETVGAPEEGSDPTALLRLLVSFDEAMQPHARALADRYVESRLKWSPSSTARWLATRSFLRLLQPWRDQRDVEVIGVSGDAPGTAGERFLHRRATAAAPTTAVTDRRSKLVKHYAQVQ